MQTDGYMVNISEQKYINLNPISKDQGKSCLLWYGPFNSFSHTGCVCKFDNLVQSCSWTALSFSLPGWLLLHHSISFILYLPHA